MRRLRLDLAALARMQATATHVVVAGPNRKGESSSGIETIAPLRDAR